MHRASGKECFDILQNIPKKKKVRKRKRKENPESSLGKDSCGRLHIILNINSTQSAGTLNPIRPMKAPVPTPSSSQMVQRLGRLPQLLPSIMDWKRD